MTKQEWIAHLRHQIEMLDHDAGAQRKFAEKQNSLPEDRAATLKFAASLEDWAAQTRQQLKRFEEE